MQNVKVTNQAFLTRFTDIFKALTSIDFYYRVLGQKRGFGLSYLLFLCAFLSIAITFKVQETINYYKNLELPKLVSQIPASYLDSNGNLSSNSQNEKVKEIYNSKGKLVILYNVDDFDLYSISKAPNIPEVLLLKDGLVILGKSKDSFNKILWTSIISGGVNFDPYMMSKMADEVASTSPLATWLMVTIWFFIMIVMNVLLVSVLARLMFALIFKLRLSYKNEFRLSAYANTSVAVLMLLQFFMSIPLTLTIMCLIPLVYLSFFAKRMKVQCMKAYTAYANANTRDNSNNIDTNVNNIENDTQSKNSSNTDGEFKP